MTSATLDPAEFTSIYPQYSDLSTSQIQFLFESATDYLANNNLVISDVDKLKRLLYLLTAHLAFLFYPDSNGNGGGGSVGRVSDAEEGSVSVSLDVGNMPFNASWFAQSQFGYSFWFATASYRRAICYHPS